jgi:cobalamin biosynthesis Co2+ chelatase CbiK
MKDKKTHTAIAQRQENEMKEYEVKVSYTGHIILEALSQEEAIEKAREIWSEEASADVAKYSEIEIESELEI